jgi:hypothetical protein
LWVTNHGGDCFRVQAIVRAATQAKANQTAQVAQTARDEIDAIQQAFAPTTASGTLGPAELDVFNGVTDLTNAMAALVAYTKIPNAAALSRFTRQYATASSEWNNGVRGIWELAHQAHPPSV